MANRLKALRAWIALFLVGLAYRISPAGALPERVSEIDLPKGGGTRFRVDRQIAGNKWSLYDGPDGGLARRTFEGVKQRRELGSMQLLMIEGKRSIVRGQYP